jgi:hypothetical protein
VVVGVVVEQGGRAYVGKVSIGGEMGERRRVVGVGWQE